MALIYELIRRQVRDLHLIEVNGGPQTEFLVGAGCVAIWESCWVGHELVITSYSIQYTKLYDVHVKIDPRRVLGFIRREIDCRLRNVFRFPEPAERNL